MHAQETIRVKMAQHVLSVATANLSAFVLKVSQVPNVQVRHIYFFIQVVIYLIMCCNIFLSVMLLLMIDQYQYLYTHIY